MNWSSETGGDNYNQTARAGVGTVHKSATPIIREFAHYQGVPRDSSGIIYIVRHGGGMHASRLAGNQRVPKNLSFWAPMCKCGLTWRLPLLDFVHIRLESSCACLRPRSTTFPKGSAPRCTAWRPRRRAPGSRAAKPPASRPARQSASYGEGGRAGSPKAEPRAGCARRPASQPGSLH